MSREISTQDAQYIINLVTRICTEVGPGIPGSRQERERAGIIKEEMESLLGKENMVVEDFRLAPGAFVGVFPLCAALMALAVLLNISAGRLGIVPPWLISATALVLTLCAALLVVFEFGNYRELIDPLLKQGVSENVIGVLHKPGGKSTKRVLILSGHHDSAPENFWLRYLGMGMMAFAAVWFLGWLTLVVMNSIQLAGALSGNAGWVCAGTIGWLLLVFPIIPAIIYALFFTRWERNGGTVPGAVDNLSGCGLTVALCRYLVENPELIPDETEIRFITFGSEEAGLRGSKRYVARHLDELRRLDARVLNFEMVAHPEVPILTTDVNNAVKNSLEIVRSVAAAAARAGIPHVVKPYPPGSGGSDAGPFTQARLKALTLLPFKMPEQMVAFYHQKWDTPDKLTVEPLVNVLKLSVEWIRHGGE